MLIEEKPTELVKLLNEAFKEHGTVPPDCWISAAIDANQWDFKTEIEVVSSGGGRKDAIRRLREEHPLGRPHLEDHDDRLMSVFTEIEAYAWAVDVAGLGTPEFVFQPGCPDLRTDRWWIEAKTVESSASIRDRRRQERETLNRQGFIVYGARPVEAPHPGLLAKFQSQLTDSVKKWSRQQHSGQLVTFFNLASIDFPVARDHTRNLLVEWAANAERQTSSSIVIVENWRWATPLFSPNL